MTTYADLVEATIAHLHGYTEHTEQATTLTSTISVTAGSITFSVTSATALNKGYLEIDSELMYVESIDSTTGMVTIPAWGRGQQGSTAATHAIGAKVAKSPRFPRARVKRTINECINSFYPTLFVVASDESLLADSTKVTYSLPAAAQRIIRMSWQDSGVPTYWMPIERWRVDVNADVTQFPTGRSVDILDAMEPGRTIRIVYEAIPSALTNDSDVFTTVTGLSDSAADVVTLCAAYRLITGTEMSRTQPNAIEQSERAQIITGGTATNISKYLYGLYQQRLLQERDKLLALYPPRIVRTW